MSNDQKRLADEAAAWFAKIRRSDFSEQDRRRFEAWKLSNPEHQKAWEAICGLWDDPALLAALHAYRGASRTTRGGRSWLAGRQLGAVCGLVVGVIIMIVAGGDWLWSLKGDYRTAVGEQRVLQLSDGSGVTMNTRTAIAADFLEDMRHVRLLTGEAIFSVAHDPHKPFVVETGNVVARAMQTVFLVQNYGSNVEVAVLEGTLDVGVAGKGNQHVLLGAQTQVTVTADRLSSPTSSNWERLTAWMKKRLVYDDAPLSQVVEDLNRYYPGHIVLIGSAGRRIRVSGTYYVSDVYAVLDVLTQTLPIREIELAHRLVILY
jgi:transmembrane sensor